MARHFAKKSGFTLIEILVASVVLSLFLGGLYTLFGGGQRIAAKSSWLQFTIDRLRMTQQAVFKAIKTSSYPSTISPSNIYDAGGTEDNPGTNAGNYFVNLVAGTGKITAPDIIKSNDGVFLVTTRSEPEMAKFQDSSENKAGTICWNVFYMKVSQNNKELGTIYMDERTGTYSTSGPNYARSLNLNFASATNVKTFKLAEDIAWIDFQAASLGYSPSEIKITISAQYYRDKKLSRESIIKVIPNVGVKKG
jgi:prepilin-type N-terminal cleavage/methylation domain-containing protein